MSLAFRPVTGAACGWHNHGNMCQITPTLGSCSRLSRAMTCCEMLITENLAHSQTERERKRKCRLWSMANINIQFAKSIYVTTMTVVGGSYLPFSPKSGKLAVHIIRKHVPFFINRTTLYYVLITCIWRGVVGTGIMVT